MGKKSVWSVWNIKEVNSMNIALVTIAIFLFNIPFGYWRTNVKKMSLQWILAIHIPIPFIILLRITTNIGFASYTYPIFIAAFFLGQFSGTTIFHFLKEKYPKVSSCFVMDCYRNCWKTDWFSFYKTSYFLSLNVFTSAIWFSTFGYLKPQEKNPNTADKNNRTCKGMRIFFKSPEIEACNSFYC